MNKAERYAAYYIKNRERILAKHRSWDAKTRRSLTRKRSALTNFDYREAVVLLLLERDGNICQLCSEVVTAADSQIDHIVQRAVGGTNEPSNLRLVHKHCNAHRPKPRRNSGN
jgi:5-methylcytosine-specific restriction endonuclease McrA